MRDSRVVIAISLSILLHGFIGWWWFGGAIKYSRPDLNSAMRSTLQFEVVDSQSTTSSVVSPAGDSPSPLSLETQSKSGQHDRTQTLNVRKDDFLGIDEVDVPAAPVGEWVIDFSRWPPGRSEPIIIEMWISAAGKLEHWELVSDTSNREIAEMSLRQLDETPINPALLNGKKVASFRRIEIVFDVDP